MRCNQVQELKEGSTNKGCSWTHASHNNLNEGIELTLGVYREGKPLEERRHLTRER